MNYQKLKISEQLHENYTKFGIFAFLCQVRKWLKSSIQKKKLPILLLATLNKHEDIKRESIKNFV